MLVVGVAVWVASGTPIVGSASADTVDVSGTVNGSILIDAVPSGAGCPDVAGERTFDFGGSWAGTPTTTFADGLCTITFESNNATGAEVTFQNANPGTAVFCNDADGVGAGVRDCADGSVASVSGTGNTLSGGSNRFGLALAGIGGGGSPGFGVDVSTPDAAPLATDPIWAEIPTSIDPAAQLCFSGAANAGTPTTCDFVLGVHGQGTSTQPAGTYSARINFATQAL